MLVEFNTAELSCACVSVVRNNTGDEYARSREVGDVLDSLYGYGLIPTYISYGHCSYLAVRVPIYALWSVAETRNLLSGSTKTILISKT